MSDYYDKIKSSLLQCAYIIIPIVGIYLCYIPFYYAAYYTALPLSLYVAFILGFSASLLGIQYKDHRYAYGATLAGFSLLYTAFYQLYHLFGFDLTHLMFSLIFLHLICFIAALLFDGRLLALMGIIAAFGMPIFFDALLLDKQSLAVYLITLLALVMIIAYVIDCFALTIVSFVGYLLYNQHLLKDITTDAPPGVLSLNELFYMMGALFVIYTVLPIVGSLFLKRDRCIEALMMVLVGAYTFIVTRVLLLAQLQRIYELPFFLKIWLRDVPTITNIHAQMFMIYACAYAGALLLLLLINRRAQIMLATLLNLCCLNILALLHFYDYGTKPINDLLYAIKEFLIGCGGWI